MIVRRIFHWAETRPDHVALVANGQAVSYAEFAQAIARARGFFARRGWRGQGFAAVSIDDRLGFWVVSFALRSLGLTTLTVYDTAALGRAGFPYVPLVAVSAIEQRLIGYDAACEAAGASVLPVILDGEAPLNLSADGGLEGGHVLQTSGTTGAYKLILISPDMEAGLLARRRAVADVGPDSTLGVFDFNPQTGVGYKWPTSGWDVGATVVCQSGGSPSLTLSHPGLTHAWVVPTLLQTLLAEADGAYPYHPNMRLSVAGGTITQSQIDGAKARIAPHIYNSLSSTESHIIAYTRLDTPDDHRWQVPAVGAQVEIVDDAGRLTAIGETGALRIATKGAPNGYLNDPETSAAFFRDGFFYTGDLAQRRADGRFALQGRATDVINIQGHKVSPAPIEDRLREALGVTGVCLYSKQDTAGEEQLHVVIEAPAPLPMDRLVAALRAELRGFPDARVRYVAALPRNAMSKVMRAAVTNQTA